MRYKAVRINEGPLYKYMTILISTYPNNDTDQLHAWHKKYFTASFSLTSKSRSLPHTPSHSHANCVLAIMVDMPQPLHHASKAAL